LYFINKKIEFLCFSINAIVNILRQFEVIDGSIRKINLTERVITMSSGESIRMDDIMSIKCENEVIP